MRRRIFDSRNGLLPLKHPSRTIAQRVERRAIECCGIGVERAEYLC
ncbi:MAG TPA: hypothetical protein VGH32_11600 [Pirellulales bacterium]